MKVLIDACVLYPTVMREMVLGAAAKGLFVPCWSARILEEWARAARKLGPDGPLVARGEIAQIQTRFSDAQVEVSKEVEARLWLPDPGDVHVLAAAIGGSADLILTLNAKDFPRRILAEHAIARADPDGFLVGLAQGANDDIRDVAQKVLDEARRLSGEPWEMRRLMRKARLPRLGKLLS